MALGSVNSLLYFCIVKAIQLFSGDRLFILCYHRVLDDDKFFSGDTDIDDFQWQMALIKKYFSPLKLSEAVEKLHTNKLPRNSVVITFDDGYKDNIDNALSILKKYDIPAVFFITTGALNNGMLWNDIVTESIKKTKNTVVNFTELGLEQYILKSQEDKVNTIEEVLNVIKYQPKTLREKYLCIVKEQCQIEEQVNLMMSDKDIITLHYNDMEIGGHTESHPILTKEASDVVTAEITKSKHYLENLLNIKITSFAFPNGIRDIDYTEEHVRLVRKAGYLQAVTTNKGVNSNRTSLYELNRITLWDKNPLRFLLRILKILLLDKSGIK